ncbi:MAG: alkyl sulfatase dimerization domain-containing protein [Acidimicrobiia bacterium]
MTDILELADQLFTGEVAATHETLFGWNGELVEVAPDTAFVAAFSNVAALATDDGLVLADTSSWFAAEAVHTSVRAWRDVRLDTAVFTHGHVDHCFGVERYEEDARSNAWRPPRVVAHEVIRARFDRYVETAGYNGIINQRQFQLPRPMFPTQFRYPDETFLDRFDITVGGETIECHHDRGETDDHVWLWAPDRKVLCTGDLFIWAAPNCGNPQKVQRYAIEWANALRKMAVLDAEVLLPGHGLPILGTNRIRTALTDSATLLEHLHHETIRMMNEGARLDDIVNTVRAPADLLDKPYLGPIYDEPEFVIRNVWRLFGGWYDGDPSHLKPAPAAAYAAEIAQLAGGAAALAARATLLADAGDLRLAAQLAELATQAEPDNATAHAVRAEVYARRVAAEASTMAKGVFAWAASESRRALEASGAGESTAIDG